MPQLSLRDHIHCKVSKTAFKSLSKMVSKFSLGSIIFNYEFPKMQCLYNRMYPMVIADKGWKHWVYFLWGVYAG